MMTKCIFQDCKHEATRSVPILIGPTEEHFDAKVCDVHYKELMYGLERNKSVSIEIKEANNERADLV